MTENKVNSFSKKLGTPIIGLLTLVLTIIALIPAFLSLNDKEAEIYYSIKSSHITIPSKLDSDKAISTLEGAGIPGSTLELSLINQGNTKSESTKFEIELPKDIIAIWSEPSKEQNPIWVDIPDLKFAPGDKKLQAEIKNFSSTRPLRILVGYKYSPKEIPTITVFTKGQPAAFVDDIKEVPLWSKWRVFYLPAYVFLGGIGFIILWSFIVALIQNPSFRNTLMDSLTATASIAIGSLLFDLLSEIKKQKKDIDDTPNKTNSADR